MGSFREVVPGGRRAASGASLALGDRLFRGVTGAGALAVLVLFALLAYVVLEASSASLQQFGLGFLWGTVWNANPPAAPGQPPIVFGALPFIDGTLVTAALAMLIGIPISLGVAIFLSELSPTWLRGPISLVVELLAAVPSIIYGLWGFFYLRPIMQGAIEPWLAQHLGPLPIVGGLFLPSPSGILGLDKLTAGVILAIMVIPTISAIARDAFLAVPTDQREAAFSLGATGWETTWLSVIPFARKGVLGGITLGLGRAVGETIAVTFLIGNDNHLTSSLLAPGQSIASWIATEFTVAQLSLEKSALLELAFVLLVISLVINVAARLLISGGRLGRRAEASA
ncbi:MAG TPA: phosphate ABC transporter permease subunit PstC [Thermoplasmata archaeon]|nr:phosphate ABC transporter permease subunit PstC [Thermoplasmata archaeon]HEV2429377.1 phosphate ABC transporter permease subunit PstC [Thermoplasmata archaeon]